MSFVHRKIEDAAWNIKAFIDDKYCIDVDALDIVKLLVYDVGDILDIAEDDFYKLPEE